MDYYVENVEVDVVDKITNTLFTIAKYPKMEEYLGGTFEMPMYLLFIFFVIYFRRCINDSFAKTWIVFVIGFVFMASILPFFELIPALIFIVIIYEYLLGVRLRQFIKYVKENPDYDPIWTKMVANGEFTNKEMNKYRYISMVLLIGLRLAFYFIVGY